MKFPSWFCEFKIIFVLFNSYLNNIFIYSVLSMGLGCLYKKAI